MKVSEFLPQVKANRHTYYNLSKEDIEYFKKSYSYLKKHQNKEVGRMGEILFKEEMDKKEMDYVKKIKAIKAIAHNINHK